VQNNGLENEKAARFLNLTRSLSDKLGKKCAFLEMHAIVCFETFW
jgi:hypothetical protein